LEICFPRLSDKIDVLFWPIFERRLGRGTSGKSLVAADGGETDDGLPPFCSTEFEVSNADGVDG
jgi:hypothetical protein